MTKKITAICATVRTGKMIYITGTSTRSDKKKAAYTSFNQHDAMDFGSTKAANEMITQLHNPLDREWKVETIEVNHEQRSTETDLA